MEALSEEHTLGPVRYLEVCLVKDAASLLQMVGQARSHIPDVVRQGLLRLLAQAGSIDEEGFLCWYVLVTVKKRFVRVLQGQLLLNLIDL